MVKTFDGWDLFDFRCVLPSGEVKFRDQPHLENEDMSIQIEMLPDGSLSIHNVDCSKWIYDIVISTDAHLALDWASREYYVKKKQLAEETKFIKKKLRDAKKLKEYENLADLPDTRDELKRLAVQLGLYSDFSHLSWTELCDRVLKKQKQLKNYYTKEFNETLQTNDGWRCW